MTLTDAGTNWYDLRLSEGALVPGKFGNALSLAAEKKAAAVFASHALDPVGPPEKLLSTLAGQDWTLEFWLKIDALPLADAVIIRIGPGEVPDFQLDLAEGAKALTLCSTLANLFLSCPTDAEKLGDGCWHHLALTRCRENVRHYLDGVLQCEPGTLAVPASGDNARFKPGFVGIYYGSYRFKDRGGSEECTEINFQWGAVRGRSWSERWHGFIQASFSGQVSFSAESEAQVQLKIAGHRVIDTSQDLQSHGGSMQMVKGRMYPFVLEYSAEGIGNNYLRLFWTRLGADRELVPSTAFWHTDEDLKNAGIAYDPDNFALGLTGPGGKPFNVYLDELRVSDVVRYKDSFTPPDSFSRNYRRRGPTVPPKPAAATGPVPLFGEGSTPGVLPFGARKHLFIDDAILEEYENLKFTVNPPQDRQVVTFAASEAWEGEPGRVMGPRNVFEANGKIVLEYTNSHMWSRKGERNFNYVVFSHDGLYFVEKPKIGEVQWNGSANNNIVLGGPIQGNIFEDANPNIPPEERFKFTAYFMTRGIYLFVSPDGLHWRRNETIMLPFDCGGGVEAFWDDQHGRYVCYIRHEAMSTKAKAGPADPGGRAVAMAVTREVTKPWPFKKLQSPSRKDTLPMPASAGELPIPFYPTRAGQPYRTRATKYRWAPDTYLAFVWRIIGDDHTTRRTELAVSRDGLNWKNYGEPFYIPNGWEIDGGKVIEALSCNGLVRRGDEIWQYAHLRRRQADILCRLAQRLDGFVSLDAGEEPGWAVTRPLVVEGTRLELNVSAHRSVRVGMVNCDYSPIAGFRAEDCDPIRGDSVRRVVTWAGNSDLSRLPVEVVRLRFELEDVKLFAFELLN